MFCGGFFSVFLFFFFKQKTAYEMRISDWSSDVCSSDLKVYVGFDLGGADPVRRAGERSMTGFRWDEIESYIPLTRSDRQMLHVGREYGLADGYTVPRHLPGEASGACSLDRKSTRLNSSH